MGDAPGRPGVPRWPSVLRVLPTLVSLLLLAGCRVDVAVDVTAGTSGGGHVGATITLDKEAAAQVPDLARQLRIDDLEQAGWEVDGPELAAGEGGGVTLRVFKRFTSPAGAARAIDELSGEGGPFSTLRVTRDRGLWKTKTALRGTVDFTAGLGAFGDAALAEKLGGPSLGLDPAAVERELGKPLAEAVRIEVVGRLPGTVSSNAPSTRSGAVVWPVTLGATARLSATSEAWNVASLVLTGLAVVSALALVVVLVRRSRWTSWS